MPDRMTVPDARRGPPGSGNGGWVAGSVATRLRDRLAPDTAVEVTLRSRVPLDTPLDVVDDGDVLRVLDGETLVVEALAAELELEVPPPPPWSAVVAGADRSMSREEHTHPQLPGIRIGMHPLCFCCGAELGPDEGCHVEVSRFPDHRQVAGAWRCPKVFTAGGLVPEPILWTALDCPGTFAWVAERPPGGGLLGRITGQVLRPVAADEDLVVSGWTLGDQGRRLYAGTALHTSAGELVAQAKATWFTFQ